MCTHTSFHLRFCKIAYAWGRIPGWQFFQLYAGFHSVSRKVSYISYCGILWSGWLWLKAGKRLLLLGRSGGVLGTWGVASHGSGFSLNPVWIALSPRAVRIVWFNGSLGIIFSHVEPSVTMPVSSPSSFFLPHLSSVCVSLSHWVSPPLPACSTDPGSSRPMECGPAGTCWGRQERPRFFSTPSSPSA